MRRTVFVSSVAEDDIRRLVDFVGGPDQPIAAEVFDLLKTTALSLGEFSERGVPGDRPGSRLLYVPFGRGAYVIQYRVYDRTVLVARIFHSLEDRPLA